MTEQTKFMEEYSTVSGNFLRKNVGKTLSISKYLRLSNNMKHFNRMITQNFLWKLIFQKEFIYFQIVYNAMKIIILYEQVKLISNTEIVCSS
jgi:hypothetical protein